MPPGAAKDLDPLGRTGDTLAGHRLFMQDKLAAALGFLHGEAGVIEENWQRAERVLAVSSAMTTLALALADASAGREDWTTVNAVAHTSQPSTES